MTNSTPANWARIQPGQPRLLYRFWLLSILGFRRPIEFKKFAMKGEIELDPRQKAAGLPLFLA